METVAHKNKVHRVLAHSYSVYFVFLLIGVSLDVIFGLKLFENTNYSFFGFILLAIASLLIIWAQTTSSNLKKFTEIHSEHFFSGPYRFSRSPTNWGLFFLMLGFGVVSNSFFVVLSAIFAFFIARFIFVDKEERLLEEKYGEHYTKYKKRIRL